MIKRSAFITATLFILAALSAPMPVYADQKADLIAAVDHLQATIEKGDIKAMGQLVDEDFVGFDADGNLRKGRAAWLAQQEAAIGTITSLEYITLGEQYVRIIGNTAIVAQENAAGIWKPKDSKAQSFVFSALSTWVKKNNKWLVTSINNIPVE